MNATVTQPELPHIADRGKTLLSRGHGAEEPVGDRFALIIRPMQLRRLEVLLVERDGDTRQIPLVVTSIPPVPTGEKGEARLATLRKTISSFEASGFGVASVNSASEAPRLNGLFPQIRFVVDPGTPRVFAGRYGPSIGAMFSACRSERVCALINSDIYLARSNIIEEVGRTPDTLFVARRVDVQGWSGPPLGTYARGIDALFFSPGAHTEILDDPGVSELQIGAPFWDIVVPVVASFHRPIVFIQSPLIFHQVHDAQWSDEDYDRLRLVAMNAVLSHVRSFQEGSVAARRFLRLAEGLIGSDRVLESRHDAKLLARLVDAWLMRIEAATQRPIEVDPADPVVQSIARAAGPDGRDFWMVESRWGRKTPVQGNVRNALRRWRKARQRTKWNALLSRAERDIS